MGGAARESVLVGSPFPVGVSSESGSVSVSQSLTAFGCESHAETRRRGECPVGGFIGIGIAIVNGFRV